MEFKLAVIFELQQYKIDSFALLLYMYTCNNRGIIQDFHYIRGAFTFVYPTHTHTRIYKLD